MQAQDGRSDLAPSDGDELVPQCRLVAERFAGQEVTKIPYDEPQNRPGENGKREREAEHEREREVARVPKREAADQDQRGRSADSEPSDTKATEPHPPRK